MKQLFQSMQAFISHRFQERTKLRLDQKEDEYPVIAHSSEIFQPVKLSEVRSPRPWIEIFSDPLPSADLGFVLYDPPLRTGFDLEMDTVKELMIKVKMPREKRNELTENLKRFRISGTMLHLKALKQILDSYSIFEKRRYRELIDRLSALIAAEKNKLIYYTHEKTAYDKEIQELFYASLAAKVSASTEGGARLSANEQRAMDLFISDPEALYNPSLRREVPMSFSVYATLWYVLDVLLRCPTQAESSERLSLYTCYPHRFPGNVTEQNLEMDMLLNDSGIWIMTAEPLSSSAPLQIIVDAPSARDVTSALRFKSHRYFMLPPNSAFRFQRADHDAKTYYFSVV